MLPAYNAARTLEKTYADIPKEKISKIILVDDVSQDQTVEIAQALGLSVVIHIQNRGYGGNQKTCYLEALKEGADVVVMLHPITSTTPGSFPSWLSRFSPGRRTW